MMSVTCSMAQPLLLSKISQGSCVPGQGGADHGWRQDTASTAPGAGEGKPPEGTGMTAKLRVHSPTWKLHLLAQQGRKGWFALC